MMLVVSSRECIHVIKQNSGKKKNRKAKDLIKHQQITEDEITNKEWHNPKNSRDTDISTFLGIIPYATNII